MRLVISGDKSRYHFFRSIVDLSKLNNQESFFTESLGEREVFLISDMKKTNENIFFSRRVPLNTELYFPSEYMDLLNVITDEDKVILFDEFPYATDDKIDRLNNILLSGKSCQVSVVLLQNNRSNLETDISTEDAALKDAEKFYRSKNIMVYNYNYSVDEIPIFLLWNSSIGYMEQRDTFFSKIKLTKLNLETFDSCYELMFDCPYDQEASISSLIEFDILASFCNYDSKLKGRNIWKIFHERAFKYYWTNDHIIKSFCRFIYQTTIDDICMWDFQKDFENLYENIKLDFHDILNDYDVLEFNGNKSDYDEFLNKHQEKILKYKISIQTFFRDKMKDIIKNRAQRNLFRVEELFK